MIQLLLLVYGRHVNHSAKTQNKYVGSCRLFSNMFHFICITTCYVLQQWLIYLWTLLTKFYFSDTTTQCGNDLLTLIPVGVIKAYFIKASIRKKKHSLTSMYHVNALCGQKELWMLNLMVHIINHSGLKNSNVWAANE